ncbi:MAG: hypothetical protein AAB730_01780 [Patescibacteria group bacterium]
MPQEQIHEEIKWLESQLEAKKKELGERVGGQEEREMVKEVLREAPEPPSSPASTSQAGLSDEEASRKADELKEKEHSHIIEELVKIAFSKNLLSALKVANSLRNPHLLDEFHDTLADHYYQKLLEARKLK